MINHGFPPELGRVVQMLYVVGKSHPDDIDPANAPEWRRWEFQGVYSTRERAEAACIKDEYFVGPVTLDGGFPDETVEWERAYYPRLEPAK